jgi:hypothetical protein
LPLCPASISEAGPALLQKSVQAWCYSQIMSQPVQDDWVLDEAEGLLDMDGRRERLDQVVADLQSGKVQPVDQATARDRIEQRIRDRRPR